MEQNSFEYKTFIKGQMDKDTAPELLEDGKYRHALNFSPYDPETGSVGVGTNVEGNVKVPYTFDLLSSNPFIRVIGSKLDLKRKRMYYFVYVQDFVNGKKAFVLYYDYLSQSIVTVFKYDNVLGFSKEGVIQAVDIVYDDVLGDTIYLTNDVSEPIKINVTAGVNRFNNYKDVGNYNVGDIAFANYSEDPFGDALLLLPFRCISPTSLPPVYDFTTGEVDNPTKWSQMSVGECYPPTLVDTMFTQKITTPYFSPVCKYNYDEENEGIVSNLKQKSYQVRYKYVYFDGEESEWSPISNAVFSKELTSAIFSPTGGAIAKLDYPKPIELLCRIPVNILQVEQDDFAKWNFFPHAMVARLRVCIREVPDYTRPQDWYEFANIPVEEFWKYNINTLSISNGFPVAESGTYIFNWDSISFLVGGQNVVASRVVTIDVLFDGRQTLIPTDIKDQSTNFYLIPKKSNTQCYADNRIFHAATTEELNITQQIYNSLSQLSLTAEAIEAGIATETNAITINRFNENVVNGVTTNVTNVFTFIHTFPTFDIADFNTAFNYSFDIKISFTIQANQGPLTYTGVAKFSGFCAGIPNQFPNWQSFMNRAMGERQLVSCSAVGGPNIKVLFVTSLVSANQSTGDVLYRARLSLNQTIFQNVKSQIINSGNLQGFYIQETYLPFRTWKNHSLQQLGVAFQDKHGRLTPILAPKSLSVEIPHFLNSSLEEVFYQLSLGNLSNITTPGYARVMHIYRKRSSSYSNFIQFALSRGNCSTQSWNAGKQFKIGILNLELDTFNDASLAIPSSQTRFLYVSLNSVDGGDGYAYNSTFNTSISDFKPQKGDIFRFLYKQNSMGVITEKYERSYEIANYNATWNTVAISFDDIQQNDPDLAEFLENSLATGERICCEIIKTTTVSENEFFWENAYQLYCKDGKVVIEPDEDRIFIYGDTYLKLRGYCVDYNYRNPTNSVLQNFTLIDKNYSDFYNSANIGEGRASIILRGLQSRGRIYSEIKNDNLIRYSEQSIQNTDRRNFAKIYDTNLQQVDNVFGRIELLHAEGDLIRIYQEDKRALVYVGRGVTTELSGAQRLIATQNNVLSDVVYEQGDFGISKDSTSFATTGYRKYYTDSKRGMVYRQSLDGITPISEVGMSGYFKELFQNIQKSYITPIVRGVVDQRTDEYILSFTYAKRFLVPVIDVSVLFFSFSPPQEGSYFKVFESNDNVIIDPQPSAKSKLTDAKVFGNQAQDGKVTLIRKPGSPPTADGEIIEIQYPVTETIVFSERTGGWKTFLSFNSEWMSSGIQCYHTFVDGQMWIHQLGNTTYNTFHDRQFNTEVQVISNRDPLATKEWRTMGVKVNTKNIEVKPNNIKTSLEQKSHLPTDSFKPREGTLWTPFYRDANENFQNGSRLKGRWLSVIISIKNPDVNNKKIKIQGLIFNSNNSQFPL